jgi:hypothetical protein
VQVPTKDLGSMPRRVKKLLRTAAKSPWKLCEACCQNLTVYVVGAAGYPRNYGNGITSDALT